MNLPHAVHLTYANVRAFAQSSLTAGLVISQVTRFFIDVFCSIDRLDGEDRKHKNVLESPTIRRTACDLWLLRLDTVLDISSVTAMTE